MFLAKLEKMFAPLKVRSLWVVTFFFHSRFVRP